MEKDNPIPEIPWLQNEQAQHALEKAQEAVRREQNRAALLLIKQKSSIFCTRFSARLNLCVAALPNAVEMTGSVNHVGTGYRVCVNKLGPIANYTHTDLFFEPLRIRCNFHEGGSEEFRFCVLSESEIGVIDGAEPMTEEEIGDYIVHRMVKIIKERY